VLTRPSIGLLLSDCSFTFDNRVTGIPCGIGPSTSEPFMSAGMSG